MNRLLVFIVTVGLAAAEPQLLGLGLSASQYRIQDVLGNVAFGHVGGPNSREEVRAADGTTRGSYSYVDGNGHVQSAVYAADAVNGFRVAATNLPAGPAVPAAPVVSHVVSPVAARIAYPSALLGAPVVHALKKRDLVAVAQPLTSYPGSTAPLVHAVHAPLVPAPVARIATPLAAHTLVAAPIAHTHAFAHILKKRSLYASPLALVSPYHAIHAGALPVPADEPIVAHAKAAQLIQQNTEGLRNNIGGIPLALPADTPEVAAGKIAHSIAHANQAAITTHGLRVAPFAHILKKRSAIYASPLALATPYHAIHAGALPVPADEPIVAHAKAAQLIQQNTEGLRNNIGGIPLALPADTPEVAAGKIAHSIAHANQAAITTHGLRISPFAHILKKRAAIYAGPLAYSAIHAGSLSVPADEPIVAHAKAAQLIQQNTEAIRNNIGGIPLALPADTPEVAAGKIAHSIAHANEAARLHHPFLLY